MAAFRAVEAWVRAWKVPTLTDAPALAPTTGACVTLRLNGEVIGRGEAVSSALAAHAADQTDLVRRAAAEAIEQATPRLSVPNDAMREQAIGELAKGITISLELAGPFTLTEPNTWGDVDGTWKPGLDGVAVQARGAANAPQVVPPVVAFPSTMLAANMIPSRAMSSVVARAIGEGGAAAALDEPKKLRVEHGLRMYRFRVTHLAQTRADAPPEFLHRGARLIAAGAAMTVGELQAMATSLATHLTKRVEIHQKQLGERPRFVVPSTGQESSDSPLQKFLVAYALTEYIAHPRYGSSFDLREECRGYVSAVRFEDETGELGAPALAGMSPAGADGHGSGFRGSARRRALQNRLLVGGAIPEKGDKWDDAAFIRALDLDSASPAVRAMILLYAIQVADGNGASAAEWCEACERRLRAIYAEGDGANVVSAMPWLGWAERQLYWTKGELGIEQGKDLPGAIALRRMRDLCWQHQFSLSDAGGPAGDDADMIGGIVFTNAVAEGRSSPYPTWQSVRPLTFIASMLVDDRLTEKLERPREIVRLMAALRFLRQLQVDESSAWMYANPGAAMGGIRASVWDSSQPVEASALTLLCIVETLKSLEAIAPPQAKPEGEQAPAR